MNEPHAPLQISVRKRTRNRLRSAAALPDIDLHMGGLGDALLDYALGLVETGKIPPALAALIKKAKEDKTKEDKAKKDDAAS